MGYMMEILTMRNSITPILIGNHSKIDTTEHEPDQAFDTWLRVLEVIITSWSLPFTLTLA